jgi:curved DNA-binding protein CbpA
MKDPDPYEILGLQPDATDAQIRVAYRRRALRTHPDKNRGDPRATENFQILQAAYFTLSDPDRRSEYDVARGRGGAGAAALAAFCAFPPDIDRFCAAESEEFGFFCFGSQGGVYKSINTQKKYRYIH